MTEYKMYDYKMTPEMERGRRVYEETIKPRHGDEVDGQLIVIDVESGGYVMNANHFDAIDEFRARFPKREKVFVFEGRMIPGTIGGLSAMLWEGLTPEEQASIPPYDHHNTGICTCGNSRHQASFEER